MRSFDYIRPSDLSAAIREGMSSETRFLAGGTTLVDLMKCGVETPGRLVDISHLPGLADVTVVNGTIRIGSLAKMAAAADHDEIRSLAPAISESLWRAASAQLRNMASIGGNLMQRTRCTYFRDPAAYTNCNKRVPGSGCAALEGNNRNHAILGATEACIATYPGDLAIALVAFDATVRIRGDVERSVPIEAFYRLPGDRPDIEHDLAPGEMIVGIEIPATRALRRSHYLKARDRASYEFAAASAAVGLDLEDDGRTIREARVALGGVATKPWRARAVEAALVGRRLDEASLRDAATMAIEGAVPREHNRFKLELAPRVVARALMTAGGIL